MKALLVSLLFWALFGASLQRSVADGDSSGKKSTGIKAMSFLIVHDEYDGDTHVGPFRFVPRHYRFFNYRRGFFYEGESRGDYDKDALPEKPGGYVNYEGKFFETVEDTHGIYYEDKNYIRYYVVLYTEPKSYEEPHKGKNYKWPEHYFVLKGKRFERRRYKVTDKKRREGKKG